MGEKTRVIIAGIFLVVFCAIDLVGQQLDIREAEKIAGAAERLYPLFVGIDFEGIEIDESENRLSLYKYANESEKSSMLVRKEVASLSVDDDSIRDAKLFKNVMDCCGGVLFATDLNWNAEWSGLCLYPSEPSLLPSQYISRSENEYAYWLSEIPDSVVN